MFSNWWMVRAGGGPPERKVRHILQHLRQGLVWAFSLLPTFPLPFPLLAAATAKAVKHMLLLPPSNTAKPGSLLLPSHSFSLDNRNLLFLVALQLPERLRSDPQCPRALTGMKTSIDFQILNRDHLFQNGFGSGVHTLQLSLGHGKDNEKKSSVTLSDFCWCPPYIP